jgi:hypothetical protein
MGFSLSSLFGGDGDSGGFKEIPSTPGQDQMRSFLLELVNRVLKYPTRQVAPASTYQTQALSRLGEFMSTAPRGYEAGIGELEKTVAGGYNPATSPEYAAYRDESQWNEEQEVNALKRSQEMRGVMPGTPALKQEWLSRTPYASQRGGFLANLMDRERTRQLNAAPALIEAGTNVPLRQIQAGLTMGNLPREITQEENDALFESLTQTLLGDYTTKAPIAQTILNEPRYAYQQGQESGGGGIGDLLGGILGPLLGGSGGGLQGLMSGIGGLFTPGVMAEGGSMLESPGAIAGIMQLLGGAGGAVAGGAGGLVSLLASLI